MAKRKKKVITAEDLYRFQLITDLQISPDGEHVLYSQQRVDRKTEKKFQNLWMVKTRGGRPKQFTYGDHVDGHPRWSPDGSEIAFISNRTDEKQAEIYMIPFDGGEARKLTMSKGQIMGFEWSPDGKRLVMMFRKQDKEVLEREKDEQKKKLGVVDRHITRIFFKMDGSGYLPKERVHLWLVDAKTGKARQLTKGEIHDEVNPAWSPDGKSILFVSNRTDDPDLNPYDFDLYLMSAQTGRFRKIPTSGETWMPSFSPDGKWIAYFGLATKGEWWRNLQLFVVPASGKGKPRMLIEKYDRNLDSGTINDIIGALALMRPTWSSDGKEIYFQVSHHGNTSLCRTRLDDDSQEVIEVISGTGVVGNYTFDAEQTKIAYYFGDLTDPGQLYVRDLIQVTDKILTRVNRDILGKIDLGEIEEVWVKGAGKHKLQGWILKPPGFSPKRKYPAILEIHGGPYVQYGNLFMHEFYYLASKGYVVFFTNPRGSKGYGEKHAKAILNNWGGPDYDDIMAWTNYAVRKPYIDKDRVGVTGGSYGGYMTNWIIGHTNRFAAAVTQRSVSNLISMWGSSDFNWVFQDEFGKKPPFENMANYWKQSPLKYIGNAKTPTLVIHSEMDQRCEIEQSEQVFVALKTQGVDTEFVRFPDEPHGLSRGGRTDRRICRLEHIVRWFDKYLKKK